MDASQLWFTVLAIVASVLSAGGIFSQLIGWWREREKVRAKERAKLAATSVEMAKVELEGEKDQRDHTGRFQVQLIDRIKVLEGKHDANADEIAKLHLANSKCEKSNEEMVEKCDKLQGQYDELLAEHKTVVQKYENLEIDYETLRTHVDRIENDNRVMRAFFEAANGSPPPSVLQSETIEIGARDARVAVTQGE